MNIVVTGDLGSGKSTAVRAAMRQLGWNRPGGFFTHWDGAWRGADRLHVETWAGEKQVLARRIETRAGSDDLPYELDPAGVACLTAACRAAVAAEQPVVLDELGWIELGAPELVQAVARLFRGPAPVLAVVRRRELDRWLEILGRERVSHRIEIEAATRDAAPARIAALFCA